MKRFNIPVDSYIQIYHWMNYFKGAKKEVYALIHSMTINSERQQFDGSAEYMACRVGTSRRSIMTILKELTESGFIEKTDIYINAIKYCAYATTSQGVKKLHRGCEETSQGGYEETSHNKKEFNKKENNKGIGGETSSPTSKPPTKKKTIEEREKDFYNEIAAIAKANPEYNVKETLRDFYDYYTERGPNDRKNRKEKMKSFCTKRRLANWFKRSKDYGQIKTTSSTVTKRPGMIDL